MISYRPPVASALLLVVLSALSAGAQAIEFKTIGAGPAVLYDAPSAKGRKLFVAPSGMPVEVVLTYGEWSKVRDASGDMSWIESKALVAKRNVVVTAANARVRTAAEDSAPIVFTADRNVLLELAENAPAGWLRVRHRDGQSGFVKAADVWGE